MIVKMLWTYVYTCQASSTFCQMQSIRYMTYVTMIFQQCADANRHQMNS